MKDYDYTYFDEILKEKGLKAIDVSRGTGIATSTLSDWKSGRTTPKSDKIMQIAEFLNVPTSRLRTGEQMTISIEGMDPEYYKFANEAITFYSKYLSADKKTRKMIDMLLEEGE